MHTKITSTFTLSENENNTNIEIMDENIEKLKREIARLQSCYKTLDSKGRRHFFLLRYRYVNLVFKGQDRHVYLRKWICMYRTFFAKNLEDMKMAEFWNVAK